MWISILVGCFAISSSPVGVKYVRQTPTIHLHIKSLKVIGHVSMKFAFNAYVQRCQANYTLYQTDSTRQSQWPSGQRRGSSGALLGGILGSNPAERNLSLVSVECCQAEVSVTG